VLGDRVDFESSYQAKAVNDAGLVDYSEKEHDVWRQLYERQIDIMPGKACQEHLEGLKILGLDNQQIPQLPDVNERLSRVTGWTVKPVNALISAKAFFTLLANRIFPAATFIRREEELDYVKEPDIFHELFGHCPMLTQEDFASFTQQYAINVLAMPEDNWALMQRLFWFTVEFGLIMTPEGVRAYGGRILSSIGETPYSVESHQPIRALFDIITIMRTPYRIDQMQPIYFVIESYKQLFDVMKQDLLPCIEQAKILGEFPPLFEVDEANPSIHIHAC